MLYICLALSILALLLAFKNHRSYSPIALFSLSNFMSLIAYCIALAYGDSAVVTARTALPIAYVGEHQFELMLYYVVVSILTMLASVFWAAGGVRGAHDENMASSPHISGGAKGALLLVTVISSAWCFLHGIDIDWAVVWINGEYLAVNDNTLVGIDSLAGQLFQTGVRFIAIFNVLLLVSARRLSIYPVVFLSLINLSYMATIMMARSSRFLPLIVFFYVIFDWVVGGRKIKYSHILFVVIGLFLYVLVMEQRQLDTQGLSQVFAAGQSALQENFLDNIVSLFINSSQSGMLFESAMRFQPEYDSAYKVLSFLPTPNVIDGFAQVRSLNEIRITRINPFNSYAEAVHFGPIYACILALEMFLLLGLISRGLKGKNSLAFMPACLMSYLLIFSAGQYQMRTTSKMMMITLVLLIVVPIMWRLLVQRRKVSAHRIGTESQRNVTL